MERTISKLITTNKQWYKRRPIYSRYW